MAERFFQGQKTEDFKDGTKLGIKLISLIVSAYIYLLPIPFVALCLQGYLCDEDP